MLSDSLIVFPIVIPLVGALLTLPMKRVTGVTGPLAATATLVSALLLCRHQLHSGPATYSVGGWHPPLGISLQTSGLSTVMVVMTAITGSAISFYARGYFDRRIVLADRAMRRIIQQHYFWPLWFMLWAALNALFLANDLFNIYVTLELITLSSAGLAALSGKTTSLIAALRYLLVSLLGSLTYLLGVAFLYKSYSTLDVTILRSIISPLPAVHAAASLICVGLLLKTAIFPLHFWLPPAHANALAPVSAILSGLVIKSSWYLLFRFCFTLFPLKNSIPLHLFGLLGAGAILWGAFQALRQQRLKMLVAYSTVAQIGYLFIIFPLIALAQDDTTWKSAVYFALSHSCAKAAMFLASGAILLHMGHDRIKDLAGVRQKLPVATFAFGIAGLSLIGLPPSGGFIAKFHYLTTAVSLEKWWIVLVILAGSLFAAAYVYKAISSLLSSKIVKQIKTQAVPLDMQWCSLLLALLSLLLGLVAPYPLLILGELG